MVNAISSSATSYSRESTQAGAVQRTQPVATSQGSAQAALAATEDSVKLSAAAQAHAMQQQGMTVKTIAANMGITTQAVDSYLGIGSLSSGGGGGNGPATVQSIAAHTRVIGAPSSGTHTSSAAKA